MCLIMSQWELWMMPPRYNASESSGLSKRLGPLALNNGSSHEVEGGEAGSAASKGRVDGVHLMYRRAASRVKLAAAQLQDVAGIPVRAHDRKLARYFLFQPPTDKQVLGWSSKQRVSWCGLVALWYTYEYKSSVHPHDVDIWKLPNSIRCLDR